jgi:hypothetical protein
MTSLPPPPPPEFNSFEWCTSPALLLPLILPLLGEILPQQAANHRPLILDVGCGSSTCAIELLAALQSSSTPEGVDLLSVDLSNECVIECRQRFATSVPSSCKAIWSTVDIGITVSGSSARNGSGVYFVEDNADGAIHALFALSPPPPSSSSSSLTVPRTASLILDKTTLDFLLASPETGGSSPPPSADDDASEMIYSLPYAAAAGWLHNILQCLTPDNGLYLCCSFHSPSFILPILGAVFDEERIRWTVVSRIGGGETGGGGRWRVGLPEAATNEYSSGGEDDVVYCFACSSSPLPTVTTKSVEEIRIGLEAFTDEYYTTTASMVTEERSAALAVQWGEKGSAKPLNSVYDLLFLGAEKDVYQLEDFLEDVEDFCVKQRGDGEEESGAAATPTTMTIEEALNFLAIMQ